MVRPGHWKRSLIPCIDYMYMPLDLQGLSVFACLADEEATHLTARERKKKLQFAVRLGGLAKSASLTKSAPAFSNGRHQFKCIASYRTYHILIASTNIAAETLAQCLGLLP